MNNGKLMWQIAGVGGAALAGIAAKQVLSFAWKKSTGRPAPKNAASADSGLAEAIAWTVISGVGVAVVQLVIQRYAANAVRTKFGEEALPKNLRSAVEDLKA
ncbi:DUF4235 domain-containing protein [Brevibacterium sp. 50QC2O2]|nr:MULTISPECIES: DUF4235 domain-containing protein [unclassified Brevibacterium]MCQ9386679.1 DUF4235 domain-containing protein [Brevibacterium sp. 68QC2CO]MCQ9388692.1 DUF4235 domain-containing protein [Brevibacterium sp. 50QC2O2]